ncbi:DUF805 domain-containing protein [Pararhizobium sp.]|uniref:DUF805 domain-containing protein n=1 Tax=Pararhizobium sp. TaxID=1977563 RepID=UPI0027272227|nr:DUF805 domain-containing protein [Pararhizobium sp.]MDO9417774.1 DUF805 domain-containing protein [Pararhizobium sp.]
MREPTMAWLFFSPSGRLGRKPYALAWLFWLLLVSLPIVVIVRYEDNQAVAGLAVLFFFAVGIASTVSSVMLTIKRLHDMGVPGPITICLFIPAICFIALIAFCVWPSQTEPNEYGRLTNWPKDRTV